jgi:hypothetical protein
MNELDYMKASLAGLYDQLERLIKKYSGPSSASGDDLHKELSGIVYRADAPNDMAANGGKRNFYCRDGKWHGEWKDTA